MNKPTLIFGSPIPPMKSGVADYAIALAYALREYFEVTLFVDNYRLESPQFYQDFKVETVAETIDFMAYDYRIYNIGNNPAYHAYLYPVIMANPGLVIFHDLVLFYLTVGYYEQTGGLYSKIYEVAGADGIAHIKGAAKKGVSLLEQKQLAAKLPLNQEMIRHADKLMVHSDYSRNAILSDGIVAPENVRKINHLSLVSDKYEPIPKAKLFKKFGIAQEAHLVSSAGFIDRTKHNEAVCKAMLEVRKNVPQAVYLMIGEGDCCDHLLSETVKKTGYVTMPEFQSLIYYSDLLVNLRYPTMGETSGALMQAMAMGKPAIVCNEGWYAELPDPAVLKLDVNDLSTGLSSAILQIVSDSSKSQQMSVAALQFVQEHCRAAAIAKQIFQFIV